MGTLTTTCRVVGLTGLHREKGEIHYGEHDAETQYSRCGKCDQPIERWWIDAEEDRIGGWSKWAARQYVIQELSP